MRFTTFLIIGISLFLFAAFITYAAEPASHSYALQEYSFGAGGTASSSSTDYSLSGIAGQVEFGMPSSGHYMVGAGLTYLMMSNVPPAPAFSNPGNWYNKLNFQINTGSNAADASYAVMVTGSSPQYLQSNYTLGPSPVWQQIGQWGSSVFPIIGLTPGETYSASVAAKQGAFTQSPFGPASQSATVMPTFSFNLSPNSISSWPLTPNSIGTSPVVTVSMSTNANGGGTAYVKDTNSGLTSSSMNHTIASVSNNLTAINEGYGAQETSVSQTTGGPMEEDSPYNTTGTSVGILTGSDKVLFDSSTLPVTSGSGTFTLLAKPATLAPPASDYGDILTVIGSADF